MPDRLDSLKKLRSWRVRPERDITIVKQLAAQVREATARRTQSGRAAAAWQAAAPQHLKSSCEVSGTSGMLTIRAKTGAARYQLDRWLRSGGEASLRSGGVTKVKVV